MPGDNEQMTDLHQIRDQVEQRKAEEAAAMPADRPDDGKVTSRFIRDCMYSHELGDGLLYAALNQNRFLYNNQAGKWLRWAGHHWEEDVMETHQAAAEDVVDRLLEETGSLSGQIQAAIKEKNDAREKELSTYRDVLFAAVKRYRKRIGRAGMIEWARTCKDPLAIRGDELDLHPWLLACENGVIDLRSGKFRDGRPDEYISKASPIEWKGLNAPCPNFEAWLLEVLSGAEDVAAFVRRAFGYAVTGLTHEHILLVLWGGGRNGKGTLVELLSYVLGPLAGPIQAEMLLDQGRLRSSAGPSPDIMSLRGLRLAFASETDEGRRFSPSRVKWLTGGDTLLGRSPHDKHEVRFQPQHTLILLTNNKPSAPAHDFAFWERIRLIPFKLAFVDRESTSANERRAKKGLIDELKKEAPGVLAWLVRGCLEYQERGLDPPASIVEAGLEYRREEDLIADFLEQHYDLDGVSHERASDLFDAFKVWFEANVSKQVFSQKRFGALMGKRFPKHRKEGVFYYVGLSKKTFHDRG